MSKKIPRKVAVLMGGWSDERPISLISGQAITDALNKIGFEAMAIDVTKDVRKFIADIDAFNPDVLFNALHGKGGEDGTIHGVLDMLGIPYTHSGVRTSAIAMDKIATKRLLAKQSVPVVGDITVKGTALEKGHPMPTPYVVKPIDEGSSLGVFIVHDDATRIAAYNAHKSIWVMVERFIPGKELTVSVLEDETGQPKALAVTELRAKTDFYDYKAKYTDGVTEHIVGVELPEDIYQQLLDCAVIAHKTLGCRHVSRSDFRYNETDGIVFLEINTQPGMTGLSLVPEQAKYCGIAFPELVKQLVVMAYNG